MLCAVIPSAIVGTAAWFTYRPYLVGTVTSRTPAVEVRARPGRPVPGMPLELFVRVQCPSMCVVNTITLSRRADIPGVLVYQGKELPTSTASLNLSGAHGQGGVWCHPAAAVRSTRGAARHHLRIRHGLVRVAAIRQTASKHNCSRVRAHRSVSGVNVN